MTKKILMLLAFATTLFFTACESNSSTPVHLHSSAIAKKSQKIPETTNTLHPSCFRYNSGIIRVGTFS